MMSLHRMFALSVACVALTASPAFSQMTWTVSGTIPPAPNVDFNTLNAALSAAQDNDTILIKDIGPHDYEETLVITQDNLTIRAENGLAGIIQDPNSLLQDPLVRVDLSAHTLGTFTMEGMRLGGAKYGALSLKFAGGNIVDCSFGGNTRVGGGGAIHALASAPIITACSFSTNGQGDPNIASDDTLRGGAILFDGLAPFVNPPELRDCTFSNNEAMRTGGAVHIAGGGAGGLTVIDCTFTDNLAGPGGPSFLFGGGAIYNNSGVPGLLIQDSTFEGNSSSRHGGAILSEDSQTVCMDSSFEENIAHDSGGAVCHWNGEAAYFNCNFGDPQVASKENFAVDGGATCDISGASTTYANCVYGRNSAALYGAGAYVEGAYAEFDRCFFIRNGTGVTTPARGGGAAVFSPVKAGKLVTTVPFTLCTFNDNYAVEAGAGLSVAQTDMPGDPMTVGEGTDDGVVLTQCRFNRNGINPMTAKTIRGGAIDAELASAAIFLSHFYSNESFSNGGAIAFTQDLINTGSQTGARISGADFNFVQNCVLAKNKATSGRGAGVYAYDAPYRVTHSTLAHNTALSGVAGVALAYEFSSMAGPGAGAVYTHNSIYWRNNGNSTDQQAGITGTGWTLTAVNSDISGAVSNGWIDGGNNLSVGPRFVNPPGFDYRIKVNSPLINMGLVGAAPGPNPLLPLIDIDQEARIQNGTIDIGADERYLPQSIPDKEL